jgi:beta-glucanase (GH16 family)
MCAYAFAMRVLMFLFVLLIHTSATAEEIKVLPTRDDSWQLVWADEFDRDGPPDPKRWEFEHGFVRNHELQWYQPENAFCRDGILIFEARRQRIENPDYRKNHRSWKHSRPHADYTSASIITPEHLSWKYGRFEIRARFPALSGLWPAIWTTGHGRWPHKGEIDIMEYYNGMILANTVHAGKGGRDLWHTTKHPMAKFDPETWDGQFHLWVMEWDEKEIAIHLDGRLLTRVDLAKRINLDGPPINPFHAPHRLRLNLAIGGNGGDPSKTRFPQRYEVDFVRIYQKRAAGL